MKKVLLATLVLSTLLFSCSKNTGEEEEEIGPAYFRVTNETSADLQNLVAGSIKNGTGKLVKSMGVLEKGATTNENQVADKTVRGIYFFFDIGPKTYMLTDERPVQLQTISTVVITNGNASVEILKTDARYPK